MPAAAGPGNRGLLEPAGHPRRYSMEKLRGVRKKPKIKVRSDGGEETTNKRRSNSEKAKVTFVQIQKLDARERVQQLIKLSEDGRKKSNQLPPLEKEASFHRQPRKGAASSSFNDDVAESPNYKRVSVEMDKKIVSHLKRHLNKRIQKRFDGMGERFEYPSDEEGSPEKQGEPRRKQSDDDNNNKKSLFNHYSETGEKIPGSDVNKPRTSRTSFSKSPSRKASLTTNQSLRTSRSSVTSLAGGVNGSASTSSGSAITKISDELRDEPPAFNKPGPLPEIRRPSTNDGAVVGGGGGGDQETRKQSVSGDANKSQADMTSPAAEVDLPISPTEGGDDDEESEASEDFRTNSVSPVQTPTLGGEESRMSLADNMSQILDGTVHKKCPADKTVINLYIASGYSDTEAERSFMQEHLYPKLRDMCKQQGHELRILDLHWGFQDTLCDDHKILDVMRRNIDHTHHTALGINFVILLGEKYGPSLLPAYIPSDEFEVILKAAISYREKQKKILRAKMAEIEAQRLEREVAKVPDDAESIATVDTQPSSARTNDDQSVSARQEEGKGDAETNSSGGSSVDKEQKRKQNAAAKKEQQAMKMLREAEEQLPDIESLSQWYVMDQNLVPLAYRLQNISSVYKDIMRNDAAKRAVAKSSFNAVAAKLLKLMQTFARKVIRDPQALKKYTTSGLDVEVGMTLEHERAAEHTACIVRTFENLTNHLDDSAAANYIDIGSEKPLAIDKEAWRKIQTIRDSVLEGKHPFRSAILRKVTYDRVNTLCLYSGEERSGMDAVDKYTKMFDEKKQASFLLEWTPGGLKPGINREHFVYCERVGKALHDLMARHLDTEVTDRDSNTWQTQLFDEVAEHVRCSHEKASGFQGRKDILTLIKAYLQSHTRHPLVIHGKTGCGKSALMGKIAKDICSWFRSKNQDPRVIVRMVGSTMTSTNVYAMLRNLCLQLCYIFGHSPAEVPTDFKGIFNDLACRMGQATRDRPLVILLDGVDRLTDEHDGRKLQWLPPELPPNVRLIISTISDEKFQCLPSARKVLSGHENCILEIDQLPEQDATSILGHWLRSAQRTLTTHQMNVVVSAFKECPYPLYLKVAFTEALTWTSYTKPDAIKLGETVKKIATLRFGRLERDHGEPLTRRALGYIAASRHGLTSNEMEDILSLDDAVMDDVMATHKPAKRRLPTLLWIRLREDIEDLITECRADNMKTIIWAHSQVFEAAEERYLNMRDKAPSYHKALAEYFSGLWAGKPKPYTGNDKGSDRLVASQELFYGPANSPGDGSDRVYNLRTINELPYHLTRSQQTMALKRSCLCNYEWMLAKLCGTSLTAMLDEYQTILLAEPREPELRLLSDVLHLSGKALRQEPRQLAAQIVGRLYRIIVADHPRSPGDPKKYPNLHHLLSAAKQSSIPVLIPSVECLTEPGGILFDLLSGHAEPITAITLTTDGMRAITTSKDGTMKLWDIPSGKVVKSIDGISPHVTALRTAKSNSLAVTVEGSHIKIRNLKSGSCVFIIDQYVDPASISIAAEGQVLAAVFDGSNIFRSWNMDDFALLCESGIPDKSIHKDKSILIADSSFGDLCLHAFRSANFATVQHARNGKLLKNLQCHEKSSSIVALAISREYFIICCRQQYMALHEIHTLELFDAKKGTYIRSVQGCVHDNISHIFTNLVGSHAIAVSANLRNNTSDIALFNLETEDHKHLAPHPCVSTMGACLDFRYCMTGAVGENSLRVWDLSRKVNQPAPKLKKQLGVCEIWPMLDNPKYVVGKAVNNGPISVWNVAKGKCLQSAVRIERGLTEGSDALVMRNTRLIILTDRGFSSVSDDSRPVFQTVLVYDLKLKKYIRKLPGCYIVPAPSHEYVLLNNDSLLGPSDNRSHFIIWNLVSGHAVSRIKTGFKELERKRLEQGVQMVDVPKPKRATSAMMTPWDKRAESHSARKRRHENETEQEKQRLEELRKEKDNVVEQFLVSGNQKIIVASFYAHHLCVFDIESQTHTQTLQTEYSMMFLHTAALTYDGSHLVHANYDEDSKISYVTLWDCVTGDIKRRLKKETNVSALAITDDAQRVVIGRSPGELHIWDPMKSNSLRRIRGYEGLRFEMNSKIFVIENGGKAIVFAGDISVWDLEKGTVLAVFTPDTRIMVCNVVMNGQLIVFGMYDKPELLILKLMSANMKPIDDRAGVELFGETTGDTSDEDSNDDADDEEED